MDETYVVYELLKNTRGLDSNIIAKEIRKVKNINALYDGISEYSKYKQMVEEEIKKAKERF